MKILWAKSEFLHPTMCGGQIRTLEMLKRLHARHEVHYVAYEDPTLPEGPRRAGEYASHIHPIRAGRPPLGSPGYYLQGAAALFESLPVGISRWESDEMKRTIERLIAEHRFDALISDFLTPSINFPRIEDIVVFQHNVETMIWRRRGEHAPDPLRRGYHALQAKRMARYERDVCRRARRVVAVSAEDARAMERLFDLRDVPHVPTGVDVEFFRPRRPHEKRYDLVFVGSMDWPANEDGVGWFVRDVLPRIRKRRPSCSLAVVGRNPQPSVYKLAERTDRMSVTGTVPDVRPYLWESRVSIVPLRIGGGTRLKVYEAMAAGVPQVSTAVGAEGLEVHPPNDILMADDAEAFAERCLELLDDEPRAAQIAEAGLELVRTRFAWEHAVRRFEEAIGLEGSD